MNEEKIETMHQQLLLYAEELARTHRVEKEERKELMAANEKMRAILDALTDAVAVLDESLRVVDANPAFLRISSLPAEETLNAPIERCLSEKGWSKALEGLKELRAQDSLFLNPDQARQRYFKIVRTPVPQPDGKWKNLILCLRDQTVQQKTQFFRDEFFSLLAREIQEPLESVRELSEMFDRSLAPSSQERTFFVSLRQERNRLFDRVQKMLDASRAIETALPRESFDLCRVLEQALRDLPGVERVRLETPRQECRVLGYQGMFVKSVRRLLENLLQANPEETLTLSLFRSDRDWAVKFQDSTGYLRSVYQKMLETGTHSCEAPEAGLDLMQKNALLHGGGVRVEDRGNALTFAIPAYSDEADKAWKQQLEISEKQALEYARDLAKTRKTQKILMTRLRKTEEQLVRSEKLGLMGKMAAGIAHEMNNLLAPIKVYSYMILQNKENLEPKIARWVQSLQDSGQKAAEMLGQMLDFSRQDTKKREKVEILDSIEKVLALLEFRFRKSKVEIVRIYACERLEVMGKPGELEQVFTNLAINALDVMPQGGCYTIAVDREISESEAWVRIEFGDTGPGVPPEIRGSIFDPFFTTKSPGKGTGLGLFVSQQIVEKHGGLLDVSGEPGAGAKFTVKLPSIPD